VDLVQCNPHSGDRCTVLVQGSGLITGEISTRGFRITLLNNPPPLADEFIDLTFGGFAASITQANLQPDLIFDKIGRITLRGLSSF
jgi:hypothetical protein